VGSEEGVWGGVRSRVGSGRSEVIAQALLQAAGINQSFQAASVPLGASGYLSTYRYVHRDRF
jgi:hypothetical protein